MGRPITEFFTNGEEVEQMSNVINLVGYLNSSIINVITGDKYFRFEQSSPSAVWNINHNLEKNPSVSIIGYDGNEIVGDVEYVDDDNLIIRFSAAVNGIAYLN